MRSRLLFVLVGLAALVACGSDSNPASPSGVTELQVTDLMVGTGDLATSGSRATVDYAGWLYDSGAPDNKGRLFDSGQFSFVLGSGGVISGFDQGVTGMRVGGLRRLVIPPSLAYGSSGQGSIPPNATLIFEVALVSIG